MFAKDKLRKKLRAERLTIAVATRAAAALAACALFTANSLFRDNKRFAVYIAHGGEFDLAPLMEKIWQAGKQCYLPVLAGEILKFVKYEKDTVLQTNKYHILEPEFLVEDEIAAGELDVVLMPLTAFNREGYRLGSGGGFYDKTFAFLREKVVNKPKLIGVGYAAQEIVELPFDEWDVKLDGVVTEKEVIQV